MLNTNCNIFMLRHPCNLLLLTAKYTKERISFIIPQNPAKHTNYDKKPSDLEANFLYSLHKYML